MASTSTTTTTAAPIAPTKKWSTELQDTGYISKQDLEAKLVEIFEKDGYKTTDYRISTRNERWIYYAPRELTITELKSIMDNTPLLPAQ